MYAAIYARKSTDQTGVSEEQKSIARQLEGARAFAARKGWTVLEDYVIADDKISGAEFEARRPGFVRLMAALKPRPPFQAVIMAEKSRLGREQIETSYALKQLVQSGVRVFYYIEDKEETLDSPTDKIMMSLTAFADELEREKARVRTKDAMTRKAKAGHATGGQCFGYVNHEIIGPDGKRSHVERTVNEIEAPVVREIFILCAQGYGKTRIAKLLNDKGAPSPRSMQGRPRAWSPSSVHSVLYRETYRGVIVWNKSKKRDGWGQQRQKPRPETEWLTIDAPHLRIVSDEQWNTAHARLSATRETYLRANNGRIWGRPPSGVASKYLLVGLARCGHCGAGLEVRSRSHGKTRAYYYSCSSFYRRGKAICPNRIEIPMTAADGIVIETVLSELLTPERLAVVTARAAEITKAGRESGDAIVARAGVERQLADVRAALDRLTGAVAAGGDVPALVEAIKMQDGRRRDLEARLAVLSTPLVRFDAQLAQHLQVAVVEWRKVLTRQVGQARQIVQKLLASKIAFTPEEREEGPGFLFRATGTLEKLIGGAVPGWCGSLGGDLQAVVSPTGLEPVLPP